MIDSKIYNPAGQSKEWLIEHFVVRTKVFEKLFKEIQSGKMKYPEQHYLIQGQRGLGKTTLLLRLKYEIENTPDLKSWLIPVFFNEESYDLTSLSNLWEKLLKYLDELWQTNGKFYKKTDEFVGQIDYEKKCFNYLLEILNAEKKKLIIFFDNFGQLFLDNLKGKEQQRLREVLMNCPDIRIIGASAVVMNDLYDYSKPFFEFFKIIKLEGLDKNETVQLIEKLQEKSEYKIDTNKNKAKIETLAILTGGVIRTIMLIYEAILVDEDGTALRDLELILDRITPLYKHRIEDLPVQQRRIVDVIAKKWDAISTKEIAENIREDGHHMATKIISAQLQQLEKNNIIEKKQTNIKNHLYQLKERFFNIWYLMRHGDRHDKCRVIWLTKFLEMWYEDENGFNLFVKNHIKHLKSGTYHIYSAIAITEALSNSNKLDLNSLELLIKETSTILNDDQKKMLPDITKQKKEKILTFFENKEYNSIIAILSKDKQDSVFLIYLLACSYYYVNNIEMANKTINKIKPIHENNNYALGQFYRLTGDIEKSNFYLGKCKNRFRISAALLLAVNNMRISNFKEAIEYFKTALENKSLEAYEGIVDAYLFLDDPSNAEKYCKEAIESGFTEFNKNLTDIYLTHYNNKVYQKEAEAIINKGLKENKNDPDYIHLKGVYEYFYTDNDNNAFLYFKKANDIYNKNKIQNLFFLLNLSLILSLLIKIKKDKKTSLEIIESQQIPTEIDLLLYLSFIKIWVDQYNEGLNFALEYLEDNYNDKQHPSILQDLILLLLAKKQFHSALKIFNFPDTDLKNKFKPIYYVLMNYLKDEYPNEIIKMGEELKQPVNDIIKHIEQMAIDYK